MESTWFEVEGERELDQNELAFVRALRSRTPTWDATGVDSFVWRAQSLIAYVDLAGLPRPDGRPDASILTFGLHFDGVKIRCDELHNQLFSLPDMPTELAFEASGQPEQLGHAAAEWFEKILSRPIVRHEWLHLGRVYAERYLFQDTGNGLSQMYNELLAPPGRITDRKRQVGRNGWVRVDQLGPPDQITKVR